MQGQAKGQAYGRLQGQARSLLAGGTDKSLPLAGERSAHVRIMRDHAGARGGTPFYFTLALIYCMYAAERKPTEY